MDGCPMRMMNASPDSLEYIDTASILQRQTLAYKIQIWMSRIPGINSEIGKKPKKIAAWSGTRKLGIRLHGLKHDMPTAWDDLHLDEAAKLTPVHIQQKCTGYYHECWPVIIEASKLVHSSVDIRVST